jgi:hypothetical protein
MMQCEVGYYNDEIKLDECKDCPIGSYCDQVGMTAATACETDRVCLSLNTITPMWCDIGYYAEDNECKDCPAD